MSLKKKKDYDVGFGRTPPSGRFSATNQPKRPPNYARPKGKTISEIGREVIDFTPKDGIPRRMTVDELYIEQLIAGAMKGDMYAARTLLALLDAEEDEWALKAPGIGERKQKQLLKLIRQAIQRFTRDDAQLQDLGLIEVVNGKRVVPASVRQACALRDQRRLTEG